MLVESRTLECAVRYNCVHYEKRGIVTVIDATRISMIVLQACNLTTPRKCCQWDSSISEVPPNYCQQPSSISMQQPPVASALGSHKHLTPLAEDITRQTCSLNHSQTHDQIVWFLAEYPWWPQVIRLWLSIQVCVQVWLVTSSASGATHYFCMDFVGIHIRFLAGVWYN